MFLSTAPSLTCHPLLLGMKPPHEVLDLGPTIPYLLQIGPFPIKPRPNPFLSSQQALADFPLSLGAVLSDWPGGNSLMH